MIPRERISTKVIILTEVYKKCKEFCKALMAEFVFFGINIIIWATPSSIKLAGQ